MISNIIEFSQYLRQYTNFFLLRKKNKNPFLEKYFSSDKLENKDVIIVFKAKEDHNGAISALSFSNFCRFQSHKNIKVVFKEVSCISEMENEIDLLKLKNNCIKGLFIHAHGTSDRLILGKKEATLDLFSFENRIVYTSGLGNIHKLEKMAQKIDKDAVIILKSCSTGRVDVFENTCIAQAIATTFEGRLVIAPIRSSTEFGAKIKWNDDKLSVSFTGKKLTSRTGVTGKLQNLFNTILYYLSLGFYNQDITAKFRHFSSLNV